MADDRFDNIPNIRLEKDDLESFKRTRAQTSGKPSTDEPQPSPQQVTRSGVPWWLFLLVVVALAAAGVYWALEQQKVQVQSQNRIAELENRLSATGEEMGQSTVALGVQVKELSSKTEELWKQMDKLWASAWRRNQSDIKSVKASVDTLAANTKQTLSALKSTAGNSQTELGLLQEQLSGQVRLVQGLQAELKTLGLGGAEVEQQLAGLKEKLISTALANNTLTNRIDDLEKNMQTLSKAAASTPNPAPAVN